MGLFTGKTVIVTAAARPHLRTVPLAPSATASISHLPRRARTSSSPAATSPSSRPPKESLEAEYGVKVLPVQADVSAGQDNEAVVPERHRQGH